MTLQQPIAKAGTRWTAINRDAVAKAISELIFEECLAPRELSPGRWELTPGVGVTYRFAATRRLWGQIAVRPETLTRDAGIELPVDDAVAFFADARETLGMSPATFCTYAKELYNTLMADMRIVKARGNRPARRTRGAAGYRVAGLARRPSEGARQQGPARLGAGRLRALCA